MSRSERLVRNESADSEQPQRSTFVPGKARGSHPKTLTRGRSGGPALPKSPSWTNSATRRNCDRKPTVKVDKTRSFDSLLKRTNRQLSSRRGEVRRDPSDGVGTKGGTEPEVEDAVSDDKEQQRVGVEEVETGAISAKRDAFVDTERSEVPAQNDGVAEYTILARPIGKQKEEDGAPNCEQDIEEKTEVNDDPEPGRYEGTCGRTKARGRPGSRFENSYIDTSLMMGQPYPDRMRAPYDECLGIPCPPWSSTQPPPFFPGAYGPPVVIPGPAESFCAPKFQCFDVYAPPPFMEPSYCPPFPGRPPAPISFPPYLPVNAPPYTPAMPDKTFHHKQRWRSSSYPRRLHYDNGNRARYHERRLDDSSDKTEIQDDDGLPDDGGAASGDARASQREPLGRAGNKPRSSASWSPSSLAEDDVEDLLPLIDQLAMEYPSSDSSTDSGKEAASSVQNEDAWFTVLPNSVSNSDRFVWSPRKDLHRPKSIWSPINPKLADSTNDIPKPRARNRTYTENVPRKFSDAPVEIRRASSCELPTPDGETTRTASGGGWSPWDCRLDLLHDAQRK